MNVCTRALLDHGVALPDPDSVFIDPSVTPGRIAPGATIHPGCRLSGADLSIGPRCIVGEEAPATLHNCRLGAGVRLKGGFFSGAVFLDGVEFGSGAHVRPGTILEEQCVCGHSVGLKQTVLFPFVTAGSLINFCDCLMAGGTDRRHHGEIGSSYVHFNFTPHGDKATPSLIGDVPRGVLLDQPAVFLGGQGGMVGPCRVDFGVVVAAGTILRGDEREAGRLVLGDPPHAREQRPFSCGVYGDIRRTVTNNMVYLGNLRALFQWYAHARAPFLRGDEYGHACLVGAQEQIRAMFQERMKRLDQLAAALPASIPRCAGAARASQEAFAESWPPISGRFREAGPLDPAAVAPKAFLTEWAGLAERRPSYVDAVRALSPAARKAAAAWLQQMVDSVRQQLDL